jgi:hypothetical protein
MVICVRLFLQQLLHSKNEFKFSQTSETVQIPGSELPSSPKRNKQEIYYYSTILSLNVFTHPFPEVSLLFLLSHSHNQMSFKKKMPAWLLRAREKRLLLLRTFENIIMAGFDRRGTKC